MKNLYQFLAIGGIMVISSCSTPRYTQQDNNYDNQDNYSQYDYSQQQQTGLITYQQFYNDLSPYGNWTNYGNYGNVWIPNQQNFRPYYTNGQWVYTDYGWTWASNYNWGWAPFHYGRWIQDRSYGWMWIPGTEWAPAWVSWRSGGDYYGWAPLGPGMNAGNYNGSYDDWTFVPRRYINSSQIDNYYINQSSNLRIINNTTIINNTNISNKHRRANTPYYNPGPSVREVERSTGSQIRRYNVVSSNKPEAPQINNNSIRVFRPTIKQPENSRTETVTDPNQTRMNNQSIQQGTNNQTAPERQFPTNQAPQINRNDPPANNRPSVIPDRNNAPARAFPNTNTQTQTNRNSDFVPQNESNRNPQPVTNQTDQNQNLNTAPVRNFPNRNTVPPVQRNPDPVLQNQSNSQPTPSNQSETRRNEPVRTFPSRQEQINANPVQQNPPRRVEQPLNIERQNNPERPTVRQEVRSNINQQVNKPVVREKQELRDERPTQNGREPSPQKNNE